MGAIAKLKDIIGGDGESIQRRTYECRDCEHSFTSAKVPERAQCPECLSNDVEQSEG